MWKRPMVSFGMIATARQAQKICGLLEIDLEGKTLPPQALPNTPAHVDTLMAYVQQTGTSERSAIHRMSYVLVLGIKRWKICNMRSGKEPIQY